MILSASQIAAALGGQVNNLTNVTAPGPGHGASDGSLSVTISPTVSDGFIVHSFSGQGWRECKDYVRDKLCILDFGSEYKPAASDSDQLSAIGEAQKAEHLRKCAKLSDAARIWKEAQPLRGSLAEQYLKHRIGGADIPEVIFKSDQTRFHPKPYFEPARYGLDPQLTNEKPIRDSAGALVSRLCNPMTGMATAIHRTFITPDARNVKRSGKSLKWMLGGSGTLKLCDPISLGDRIPSISIGEGLESSLAVMVRYAVVPIWATMTALEMQRFPVLASVEAIRIWSDFDKINPATGHRTGEMAAVQCAQRWADAGKSAWVMTPPKEGVDFADIQSGRAAECRTR
ncbi:MAG: toprim domain-containing protein [Hyphomicrobiales bacterium]